MASDTPRVLRVTFEFHVPQGLNKNIRAARVEEAIEQLTATVQKAATRVFPWADRLVVQHDWSYRWWDEQQEIELPETDYNT